MQTDVEHRRSRRRRTVEEPYLIEVPDILADRIAAAVERVARRTGETVDEVRRGCEISVLKRGLDAFEGEEGVR